MNPTAHDALVQSALRPIRGAVVAAAAVAAAAAIARDPDDTADVVAAWIALSALVFPAVALCTGWLAARIERRLDPVRRPRGGYLLEAAGHVALAAWGPLVVWAPALLLMAAVEGRWRLAERSLALSVAFLVAGGGLGVRWFARSGLRRRRPLGAAPWTTWGDLVPTSVLAGLWLAPLSALAGIPAFEAARGLGPWAPWVALVVWIAAGVAAAVSGHTYAPHVHADAAGARLEIAGGLGVGAFMPAFLASLASSDPDLRWFGIALGGVGLLGCAAAWGVGRAARRERWLSALASG